jgi:hypothetical protein
MTMEKIELNIVDDPENNDVFKGPGHYPATRAKAALCKLEDAFPQLHFDIAVDGRLAWVKATAIVTIAISSNDFITTLSDALTSTGTRIAPIA